MATLSSKRIKSALQKVQDVGIYEESFTLDGVPITLRNLRNPDWVDIAKDLEGIEDEQPYYDAFVFESLCRAIVEIGDINLRNVKYIEDEVEDPKTQQTKTVKMERHAWIRDNVLSTWGKEAILTAYRKLGDVLLVAEEQTANGIVFRIPDETPEDKLRRGLGELHETLQELPPEVVQHVLSEYGLATKEDVIQKSLSKLDAITPFEPVEDTAPQEEKAPRKGRVPITARQEFSPPPVRRQAEPSDDEMQDVEPVVVTPRPNSRAARYAALERESDVAGILSTDALSEHPQVVALSSEPATVTSKTQRPDLNAVKSILDAPPPVGINPRFRPPKR